MLDKFDGLESVKAGHLAVEHSLGSNSKTVDLKAARYVLIVPHDAREGDLGISSLSNEIMSQLGVGEDLLRDYLHSERDAGTSELATEILRTTPGGIAVFSQTNRGVVNANKNAGEEGAIPAIWTPEARIKVEPDLRKIHKSILNGIDQILRAVPKGTRILDVHSMDSGSFNKGEDKNQRPPLSHANLRAYVAAQGLPYDSKEARAHDFITGEDNKEVLADGELYAVMQTLFDQYGIKWAVNKPYSTGPGYPDFTYMNDFPGLVSAIDLKKSSLCIGDDRTFDSRRPVVASAKVAFMAELHKFAIDQVTRST